MCTADSGVEPDVICFKLRHEDFLLTTGLTGGYLSYCRLHDTWNGSSHSPLTLFHQQGFSTLRGMPLTGCFLLFTPALFQKLEIK